MSTYRALCCDRLAGDLAGVALRDLERRTLGSREVRVAIHAGAVNFPDLLMTRGEYQFKPPLPFVLGMEGAGTVIETGEAAAWKAGDRVCFSGKTGAFAEEIVLPDAELQALPKNLSFAEGACFVITGITAYVSLVRLARIQPREHLLVHGARGGVGAACVQLGLHLGARVIATATRPDDLAALARKGAKTIASAPGFRERVLELTGGNGADAIADPVGGDVFDESVRCIAWGGRFLVLGFTSGRIPALPVNRALIKGFSLIGVRAGEYGRRNPVAGRENLDAVARLASEGVLKPAIGLRLPLEQAKDALVAMQGRGVSGKIVVEMRPD